MVFAFFFLTFSFSILQNIKQSSTDSFEEASSPCHHHHISPRCSRPSFKKLNNQKSQMRVVPVIHGNDHHSNNSNNGGDGSMDEIQSSEYLAIEPAALNGDRHIEVCVILYEFVTELLRNWIQGWICP